MSDKSTSNFACLLIVPVLAFAGLALGQTIRTGLGCDEPISASREVARVNRATNSTGEYDPDEFEEYELVDGYGLIPKSEADRLPRERLETGAEYRRIRAECVGTAGVSDDSTRTIDEWNTFARNLNSAVPTAEDYRRAARGGRPLSECGMDHLNEEGGYKDDP